MENDLKEINLESNSIITKVHLFTLVNSNGIRFLFVMSPDLKAVINQYEEILSAHFSNIINNSKPGELVRTESYNYFSGCSITTLCTIDVLTGEVVSYSPDEQNKGLMNVMSFEVLNEAINNLIEEDINHGI